MFWKVIMLALLVWTVGLYFSVTLGGLIYLVPAAALACVAVRQIAKPPNTALGRWRPASERMGRRRMADHSLLLPRGDAVRYLERPVRSSRDYDGQDPPPIRYLILAQAEDRPLKTASLCLHEQAAGCEPVGEAKGRERKSRCGPMSSGSARRGGPRNESAHRSGRSHQRQAVRRACTAPCRGTCRIDRPVRNAWWRRKRWTRAAWFAPAATGGQWRNRCGRHGHRCSSHLEQPDVM